MRKFGSFILGAAIGGLIGSALALLFAPVSGGLVRERIRNATPPSKTDVRAPLNIKFRISSNLKHYKRISKTKARIFLPFLFYVEQVTASAWLTFRSADHTTQVIQLTFCLIRQFTPGLIDNCHDAPPL